jgi:SpoVK/Ycf46/Vps4 family AAA+-type ATPase
MRCRQREAVLGHLGPAFGSGMNRGVRALFSGPSGTGKTLAARIMAAELGLDLYRVDLSSVVSKYVGETERNLSRVFARAEKMDVILLFDEGDSLLTGRTDVRSANDRYANMETNYLLQRLESYEGIVVVTTNAAGRIDAAFQRRMDVHVEFTAPDASQRYRIWQLHLPPTHQAGDVFLRVAATRCVLSGGQIRNTALHASVLAVENSESLSEVHLTAAIGREYRKLGARSPLGQGMA